MKIFFILFAISVFLISACSNQVKGPDIQNKYNLTDYFGNSSYPDSFWTNSLPENEGMDPAMLLKAVEDINNQGYEIHSFIVIRHGKIVFERYGRDKSAGNKLLNPNDLHEMHSTTKTITSSLIGIAINNGLIPGVNTKIMDYFHKDGIINNSDDKEKITIQDLLTMRSGLELSEDNDDPLFD